MTFHAYGEMYTFRTVAKALYPVTHELSLPVSCTFLGTPPLKVGVYQHQTGRWVVGSGRAGPYQKLWGLQQKLS